MSAEEYRERAQTATRHARLARSQQERQVFLNIAQLWNGLAERQSRAASSAAGR
jgi:hypothetical protein